MSLENKTILITGGAGSFGQKCAEIILKKHNPKSVRIYDNRECAEVEMERKFNDPRLRFLIGDVRDKDRLNMAMNNVNVVIHAAALKHVPICEYNPIEAVHINVEGTVNVIESAINSGVEKVMAISTDKAAYPVSLYGATKMVAEKLIVQGNSYSGERKTIFSCARYGNIIASSGSVISLFNEQKKKNEISITDEKMTRFWITPDQGIDFVIKCIDLMNGGEIFVPKLPSMKIVDLADSIAPGANKKIIGIRPGERIHEILLTEEEARHAKDMGDFFVIEPELPFWSGEHLKHQDSLPEGFMYLSDKNDKWLSPSQIKEIKIIE